MSFNNTYDALHILTREVVKDAVKQSGKWGGMRSKRARFKDHLLSQLSYRPELHRTALKTMVKIDLHERFQGSMVHFDLHTCGSDCGIL